MKRACEAIITYAGWLCMPLAHILIRLDGLYGTLATLTPLLTSGLGVLVRCKDYGLLDLPAVAARLKEPPDAQTIHPESGAARDLFDCPELSLCPDGPPLRLLVATHPTASTAKPPIGILRDGIVYELFLTTALAEASRCVRVCPSRAAVRPAMGVLTVSDGARPIPTSPNDSDSIRAVPGVSGLPGWCVGAMGWSHRNAGIRRIPRHPDGSGCVRAYYNRSWSISSSL